VRVVWCAPSPVPVCHCMSICLSSKAASAGLVLYRGDILNFFFFEFYFTGMVLGTYLVLVLPGACNAIYLPITKN
jgi:hypothetical protein